MKEVLHKATLFYYDGPQVIEARDRIGGHYVGVLVAQPDDREAYVVVGVSPEELRRFRVGLVDLRSLLVSASTAEWYLGFPEHNSNEPFAIEPQAVPLEETDYLPDEGFFLHDTPTEAEVLRESRARNNLVFELAVEPPEAASEHRIKVETLIGLLANVQVMMKHALSASLRDAPSSIRRLIDRSTAHMMDVVVPAKAGSFSVLLEAAQKPDLFGHAELARALERMDMLFEHAADPHHVMDTVKANRGHLAGSYLGLLRFLELNNTGLRYAWAEPEFAAPKTRAISEAEVGPLVDILSGVSELGSEEVDLQGTLEKADRKSKIWRLRTPEKSYAGKTRDGGPSLTGLKIGAKYHFKCLEEIEVIEGTGREHRTLYLIEHEPLRPESNRNSDRSVI